MERKDESLLPGLGESRGSREPNRELLQGPRLETEAPPRAEPLGQGVEPEQLTGCRSKKDHDLPGSSELEVSAATHWVMPPMAALARETLDAMIEVLDLPARVRNALERDLITHIGILHSVLLDDPLLKSVRGIGVKSVSAVTGKLRQYYEHALRD